MHRISTIGACALAAAISGGLPSDRIAAQDAGAVISDRVQIELRGSIAPQCAFEDIADSLDLGAVGNTGAPAQKTLGFRISCNAPFSYSLSSEQAAMQRDDGAQDAGGLPTQFPYGAALSILADDGSSLTLNCDATRLRAGPAGCQDQSGSRTAIGRDASVTVSWGPVAGPLAAGHYSGALQIALSAAN